MGGTGDEGVIRIPNPILERTAARVTHTLSRSRTPSLSLSGTALSARKRVQGGTGYEGERTASGLVVPVPLHSKSTLESS